MANYCFGEQKTGDNMPHGDTIAEGKFTVRCFVEPRNFHGEIHAITNTKDKDGQKIDRNAMQTTIGGFQNGRWLIHDRYSKKLGKDTNFAWSAGCFIRKATEDGILATKSLKFWKKRRTNLQISQVSKRNLRGFLQNGISTKLQN